jgi:hypothetical protein
MVRAVAVPEERGLEDPAEMAVVAAALTMAAAVETLAEVGAVVVPLGTVVLLGMEVMGFALSSGTEQRERSLREPIARFCTRPTSLVDHL